MAEDRLKIWEALFQRALTLIDSVARLGARFEPWSFGGGTVLMRKYRHRFSKDIDIFVPVWPASRTWIGSYATSSHNWKFSTITPTMMRASRS